ncbi:extracellular solute-binding protein [Dongia rigui]|uniref:Extracellular solute-binding protein n=1 Tax=Dongia rigui TaxID=940149 RepID=A0ABU5DUN4_9PROT|nr:extracellular solute-binding protein [Dongia rigui]MDY0871002.1 extracellular solute-binding protein [Dongia rigui]
MKHRALFPVAVALAAALPLAVIAAEPLSVLLPPWVTLPKDMTDKYTEKTKGTLDIQTLGWDEIRTKIVTSMVANTAPASATEMDWSWVGQFGSAGWYDDLSGILSDDLKKDLPTTSIFTYDGKLIGVPYNNDFRVLIYNKGHLAKAGIGEAPKTPDELLADAKAVKEKAGVAYPIGLPLSATEGSATAWYLLTKAFGGELFDAEFKPLFVDPGSAGYKAMAFEISALKDGLIDPASTSLKDVEIQELFKAGKITFDVAGWAGNLAVYTDATKSQVADDTAAALVPNVDGKSRTIGLPGALGVPVSAKDKETAHAFINWMLDPDTMVDNYVKLGNLPTRISVLDKLNKEGKLKQGDVLIAQAAVVEPLFVGGAPGWYPEFSAAVATNLNAAAKGEVTVDQAVAAIAAAAEEARQ